MRDGWMAGWMAREMDGRERHLHGVSATHRDWALPRLDENPRLAVVSRPPHAEVVLLFFDIVDDAVRGGHARTWCEQ